MFELLSRVQRMLRAEAHQRMDRMEDPEAIAGQRLRELDAALAAARSRVAAAIAARKLLAAQSDSQRGNASQWQRRAESALRRGDEADARTALAEQLRAKSAVTELQPELERAAAGCRELEAEMSRLVTLRAELSRQRLSLAARARTAKARSSMASLAPLRFTESDTRMAFDALRDRVAEVEAAAEADRDLAARLDPETQWQREHEVHEVDLALEALRRQMADSAGKENDKDNTNR
jgi:phage shock protein A